jgi:hypothetical protein
MICSFAVIPAKAGNQLQAKAIVQSWIPAFAGMTANGEITGEAQQNHAAHS